MAGSAIHHNKLARRGLFKTRHPAVSRQRLTKTDKPQQLSKYHNAFQSINIWITFDFLLVLISSLFDNYIPSIVRVLNNSRHSPPVTLSRSRPQQTTDSGTGKSENEVSFAGLRVGGTCN